MTFEDLATIEALFRRVIREELGTEAEDDDHGMVERKTKRGERLPESFRLPSTWGQWAMREQPTWTADHVRREAEKFADYWHAASGQQASKRNWGATWRNWVRKAGPMREDQKAEAHTVSQSVERTRQMLREREAVPVSKPPAEILALVGRIGRNRNEQDAA